MDTQKMRPGTPIFSHSGIRQCEHRLHSLTLTELDAMRRALEAQAQLSEDVSDAHDHLLSRVDDEIAARPIVTFADIALKCRAILLRRDLDFDSGNRGASAQMLLQITDYAANLSMDAADQSYTGDPAYSRAPKR
jgi:hypothetical protein